MDYIKRHNESDFEYIVRLIDGKSRGIYDIDYTELFRLAFGVELAPDECRKRFYGLKMILPYIENKDISIDEAELKKIEIQKEKEKNRTIKIELNKMIRQNARYELFWDEVKNSIECVEPPKFKEITLSDGYKIGLVGISDIHFGKCFESINNSYSMEIAVERLNLLLNEIIDWVKKRNIEYLHIVNCGDNIEGLLRISQLRVLQVGVIDSAIRFARIMVEWLNKLSEYVYIKYHHIRSANHTEIRFFDVKSGQFPDEDLERVIVNYIHDMLQNNKNIDIPLYDNEFAVFEIYGKTIVAMHGHQFKNKKFENIVKEMQMLLGIDIDIFIMGHLHHEVITTVGEGRWDNIKLIMLPSIMGSDHFSDSLFTGSKAGATLIEFNSGRKGITTTEIVLN